MSRPLRIEYPNAWYHVMNRGRRYENIFESVSDYYLFIHVLKEAGELFDFRVSSYCLMPNHYHLLVQTPNANLSRCMRHVNGVYTQRFNREHEIDGSLFRGRYKAVCVADDQHLLEVMRYIHNNPLKAGLVENLDEYVWSSHRAYMSKNMESKWLYSQSILDMLTKKKSEQQKAYLDFVVQENSEEIEKFYSLKKLLPVFGGKTFKEKLASLVQKTVKEEVDQKILNTFSLTSASIFSVVCSYYDIDKETLLYSRRGYSNLPRDIALYFMQRYRQDTLQEIGLSFGIKKYSSVSSGIVRAQKAIKTDKNVEKDVAAMTILLSKSQKQT